MPQPYRKIRKSRSGVVDDKEAKLALFRIADEFPVVESPGLNYLYLSLTERLWTS